MWKNNLLFFCKPEENLQIEFDAGLLRKFDYFVLQTIDPSFYCKVETVSYNIEISIQNNRPLANVLISNQSGRALGTRSEERRSWNAFHLFEEWKRNAFLKSEKRNCVLVLMKMPTLKNKKLHLSKNDSFLSKFQVNFSIVD